MSPDWQLPLNIICAAVAFLAGGALTSFAFAVAAFRFAEIDERRVGDSAKISAAAKFCVENSSKIASTISIGRKLAFALAVFCIFLAVDACFEFGGIVLDGAAYAAVFAGSVLFSLFLQFAVLDIPAAKWGRAHPICVLNRFGIIFYIFYLAFIPFEKIARATGARIFVKSSGKTLEPFDYIDVAMMLRAQESETDSISPYTGKIVKNALKLQELDVSDVMLPRSQVVYLDTESTQAENIALAEKTRHTRYPLCKGDLDNCYGIVNIKNIFMSNTESEDVNLREICRETLRLKENEKLEWALAKMLKYRLHMALVEDEFGGVIGVITLDAPLSELVGKIRDEFDRGSDQSIRALGSGRYKIQGITSLHRVEDFLDVDFGDVDVSTFGGLITLRLGRFPEVGETLSLPEQKLKICIDSMDKRKIRECTVRLDESESGI